jgi:hypothetical protein
LVGLGGDAGGVKQYAPWINIAGINASASVVEKAMSVAGATGDGAVPQRHLAWVDAVQTDDLLRCDGTDPVWVTTGEQRRSCRRTDGRSGVVLGQTQTLVDQPVQCRRTGPPVAEATEITIAHVVGDDE